MSRQRKSSWKGKPHPSALTEENIEAHYRAGKRNVRLNMLPVLGLGVAAAVITMILEPQMDASDIESRTIRPTRITFVPERSGRYSHEARIELYEGEDEWEIGDHVVPLRYRIEELPALIERAADLRIWAERNGSTIVGISAPGVEIPVAGGLLAANDRRWREQLTFAMFFSLLFPFYFWPDLQRARQRRKLAQMQRKKTS